eukprot:scaffold14367_cov250-Ochromonas_danica.AAC.36
MWGGGRCFSTTHHKNIPALSTIFEYCSVAQGGLVMGQVLVGIAPQLMIKKVEVVLFLSVVLLASFFAFGMRRAHQGIRHGSTLLPRLNQLNSQFHVILASGSPRRKELLNLMGIQNFNICVSDFAEDLDKTSFPSPAAYCQETSRRKVENVIAEKLQNVSKNTIVIGADTIVVIDGMVLEKPVDDLDAKKMLLMLSGNTHEVHTSVTLYSNALPSSPGHDQPQKLQLFASFVETSKLRRSITTAEAPPPPMGNGVFLDRHLERIGHRSMSSNS